MDFDFSDDQLQLREAVSRWASKAYTFERRRAIVASGGHDERVWQDWNELGITGLVVDEAHEGMGMGPVEAMIVMEELGRHMVVEPLASHWIACRLLSQSAPEALRKRTLPRLASGALRCGLAHQERGSRYDLRACQAQAERQGEGWSLSGSKLLVPAGDQMAAWLVPARMESEGKAGLFWVEAGPQVRVLKTYPLQNGARAADLAFDGSPAELVTTDSASAMALAQDLGIAMLCAQAVGLMETTLSVTVEYMKTRKQFGVPIASFQALQHRVADMKMQLELARSMSYFATLKLNAQEDERRRALSQAKYQLGQSMRFVGQQAVQLHGGIGVTDEYIVSHCFKSLTQMELSWGDSLHHLGEVSSRMQETAGVFA